MNYLLYTAIVLFAAIFTADLILTLDDCWQAARPKNMEAGVTPEIDPVETILEPVAATTLDIWDEPVQIKPTAIVAPPLPIFQLCLPPAKKPAKSISRMNKAELVIELRKWGNLVNDRCTNQELRDRLTRCYA